MRTSKVSVDLEMEVGSCGIASAATLTHYITLGNYRAHFNLRRDTSF